MLGDKPYMDVNMGRKYTVGDKPYIVKQQVFEQEGEHWCRKAGFGFANRCERRKEMTVNVECE